VKPNILFVNFPNVPLEYMFEHLSSDTFLTLKKSMPLGILYLSSYLKKHNEIGHTGILDYAGFCEEAKHCKSIEEFILNRAHSSVGFTPDVILCSLMFSVSHVFCMKAVESFKRIWPKSVIVVGGVHATNYTKGLLGNAHIDFVFRGEAEIALSEFMRQFSSEDPIDVAGVYSTQDSMCEAPLELCEFVQDLDEIPFPDWDLIDMNVYTRISYVTITGHEVERNREIRSSVILGTRGCPGRCTFCSQHTTHGRKIRYRSVENVIEEIKTLNGKFGVTTFVPNDDMFLSGGKRDLTLLTAIQGLHIPNLDMQFPNGLHVNSMNEDTMRAFKNVGTKVVNLAIESGSDYVQRHLVKKYVNLEKAREVVKSFRRLGIFTRCFFILGFPCETKEQMRETIEYAKSLQADWCDFFEAIPLIGSEMHEQYKEMGCISDDSCDWSRIHFLGRSFDSPEIRADELKELTYRANLECNFLNNYNKRAGDYKKAISLYRDIVERYPFHAVAWYSIMECYEAMGDEAKSKEVSDTIDRLIETDSLAADMYRKYSDLMPRYA